MIRFDHLDINVVEHCNNHCISCNHASPFAPEWRADPETVRSDLAYLKEMVHFGFVALLGGEPLLHPLLPEIVTIVLESRIADAVKVITNGWLIPKVTDDFWQAMRGCTLEWVRYPNMENPDFAFIRKEAESRSLRNGVLLTIIEQNLFSYALQPSDRKTAFFYCGLKGRCVTLHDGRFYLCAQSAFYPHRFMGMERGVDGLPVAGLEEKDLRQFLIRNNPLHSCRICASLGKQHQHAQALSEKEWLIKSTTP